MNKKTLSRKDKIEFLKGMAVGERQIDELIEPDLSKLSDDELRWIVAIAKKIDENTATAFEIQRLEELINKAKNKS